ncbi:MAG: histidine phosphatase family protein [Candidatus Aenigmarchaeota archaeon]|nr:histidine phosphatase family protein [Candidatus Aenigmarchaeota archaeon]
MITIYIARHGQTEYNVQKRIQGHIDTPLTDDGYKNAFLVADRLKGIKFDHIYSSDLGRAFITAHVIAEKLNLENRIVREKRLREQNFGGLTGMLLKDAFEVPNFRGNPGFKTKNGESFKELQKRIVDFIIALEKKHKDKTALIVTHGGCIRSLLGHFKRTNLKESISLKLCNEYIGKFVIDKGTLISYEQLNGI